MKRTLFIISFVFLAIFLIFPLGYIFSHGFSAKGVFSLQIFKSLASNYLIRESITNSFLLGFLAVIFTTIIGFPLAFLFYRYEFPAKNALRILFFLPMIVSPFVGAIGMRQILSRFGSVNLILMKLGILHYPVSWLGSGFWGILILETLHLYPIMFLNISATLNNFDTSCEEASYSLGATFWQTFRKITFPLLLPGYFAASSIIFIWALTDLGTPLVFEFPKLISVQIFQALTNININPTGYGLVIIVIVLTLILFTFTKRYIEKTPYVTQKSSLRFQITELQGKKLILAYAGMFFLLFLSLIPHISIILTSFSEKWFFSILPQDYSTRFYQTVFTHPLTKTGIFNSLFYSTLSTLLTICLGFSIGFVLARTKFKGRGLLDILSMMPLVIPGIIIAFGYFTAFSGITFSLLGRTFSFSNTILDPRYNPILLLIISYSIRRLPYLVRTTYSSFQQLNENLEEASYNLGANHFITFRRITLPLISPGLFAGGILVFAFSMLEVSSTLILAYKKKFFPISKVIYTLAGRITDGPYVASALGVLGMILIGISFAIASKIVSKRIGEFFRIG